MKKIRDSLRNKALLSALFIVLIFLLLGLALRFISARLSENTENQLMEMKMSALTDIVREGNARRLAADARLSDNLRRSVNLMTLLLKNFVTEEGYTGPREFEDGFVVQLEGERVILPPAYEGFSGLITRELMEEGLRSGETMTARLDETADGEDDPTRIWLLSFGQIGEDLYYADLISQAEYDLYMDMGTDVTMASLQDADETFEGITLLLQEQEGELQLIRQYGGDAAAESLRDLGLTEETLRQEPPVLSLGGKDYACSYGDFVLTRREGGSCRIVQMLPKIPARDLNLSRVRLLRIVMTIIFVAFTVYTLSAQRYAAEHAVNGEEAEEFQPRRFRRRLVNIALLSVVVTFLCSLMIESLGTLYSEVRCGRDTLALHAARLEREDDKRQRARVREEEDWIVYYGGRLATLLSEYPELNTRQTLQGSCMALDADYIMLFDSRGRETLCSRDYTGFRLDDERSSQLQDFQRLLHGVDSIVHETAVDGMTGLERQLIGVKLPAAEPGQMHGAMILALLPERTSAGSDFKADGSFRTASGARESRCFAADAETGEILYSSDASLLGKNIRDCGLPESSLQGGFMDFVSLLGKGTLLISSRSEGRVFFYAAESDAMVWRIVRNGAIAALLFAAALTLLLLFLLGGYTEKAFREWKELRTKSAARLRTGSGEESENTETGRKGPLRRLSEYLHWDRLRTRDKVLVVLRMGLIFLIISALEVLHGRQLPNESYHTMLGFLLHGGWMRGLNLFCIYSILMLAGVAYLINLACSLLLRLSGVVVSGNGETVCRLLYSCIKYVTAIGVIYFSLDYLGFPTGTIIASLGVVSLAISLGAQDLIKDVLSGLAIVFEGCFRVGDIVEINGTGGRVLEIGARSTKLNVSGNNTLVINNHDISTIVNLSRELSEFRMELEIGEELSLLQLEELLNRELPAIGRKNAKILKGPYLCGVSSLSAVEPDALQRLTLRIGALIEEKNRDEVMLFLNREIRLLLERKGVAQTEVASCD